MKKILIVVLCVTFVFLIRFFDSENTVGSTVDIDIVSKQANNNAKLPIEKVQRVQASSKKTNNLEGNVKTELVETANKVTEPENVQSSEPYDLAFEEFYGKHSFTKENKKKLMTSYDIRMIEVGKLYHEYENLLRKKTKLDNDYFIKGVERIDATFSDNVSGFINFNSFGEFSDEFLVKYNGLSTTIIFELPWDKIEEKQKARSTIGEQ